MEFCSQHLNNIASLTLAQATEGSQALLKSSGSSPLELHPLALPSGEPPCELLHVLQIKTQALQGPIPFHRPFPLPGIIDLFSCQIPSRPSEHNSNITLSVTSLQFSGPRELDASSPEFPHTCCCHQKNTTSLPAEYHSALFTPIFPLQVGEPFTEEPGLS